MFFVLSKLIWIVIAPVNMLLFLLAFGLWQVGRGRRRQWPVASAAAALLMAVAFLPLSACLLRPLEDRFPRPPPDLAAPTGIIVLGGSTDELVSDARDQVTVADAATRITTAVELSRRFPLARLVFSGGSAALFIKPRTEAEDTKRLWVDLGVAADRITVEDRSRDTYENALFSQRLIKPQPGERWLLVTSASHMPRSVGLFRAVGFPVIPYPVDYHTSGTWLDWLPSRSAIVGFRLCDLGIREWVGLIAYRLVGRTGRLFPGPEPEASDGPKGHDR